MRGKVTNIKKMTLLMGIAVMAALISLGGVPAVASAALRYVDDDGICGGNTPCHTTINAAIGAASAYDLVIVYPGTYNEQVNVDVANLTIRGLGFPTVNGDPSAFWIYAEDVTVEKFNARGTEAAQGSVIWVQANGVTIRRNKITGIGPGGLQDTAGIFVIGPDFDRHLVPGHTAAWPTTEIIGVVIENNKIKGTTEPGISFNRVADSFISRNRIRNPSGDGIQLLSTSGQPSHDNIVERNNIAKAGIGIKVVNSSDNIVQRNTVRKSSSDGIQARDFVFSGMTTDNTFERNVIRGSGGFDADDWTTGGGTAGTANTWERNRCRTDSPDGLCD